MQKQWAVAIAVGIAAVIAIAAVAFRYEMKVNRGEVIRLDRWTGRIEACDGRGCLQLNGDRPLNDVPAPVASPALAPPQEIQILLFDGTQLFFPPETLAERIQEVTTRITACKQRNKDDPIASHECARPSVEDQLNGTGWRELGG